MTTADLVNLVVSRLDSMEHNQSEFRDEVRKDITEIKQLSRATNGRVTALERKEIDERARLEERQLIDRQNAEVKEKRSAPVRQILISVTAGVVLAGAISAMNHFGVV